MRKFILHLCADTGSDTWVYQKSDEFEVMLVGEKIGVENFSVTRWLHMNGMDDIQIVGIIANPVCWNSAQHARVAKHGIRKMACSL